MSVDQLISELKALPQEQRLEIFDAVLGDNDSWVPESFKQGLADFEAGRFVDMETALTQPPPGRQNEI
jgi:predicted transcriptional regulator